MARVPDFKQFLNVDDGKFGLALLFSTLGVLIGLGPAGRLCAKYGSRTIAVPTTALLGIPIFLVGLIQNFQQFCIALFLFGMILAIQDIAMNAHGIAVEHEYKLKFMSVFHANFSVGTFIGALLGGIASELKLSTGAHAFLIAILVFISAFSVRNWWLPASADVHEIEHRQRKKRPTIFWILGLLGLCAQVGEGAAGDWGGILARETFNASPFLSSIPYVAFTATMVVGRFLGDRINTKYGARRILVSCGLIAGFGLALGLLIGGVFGVALGWAALGTGLSVIVPVLFSASGEFAKNKFAGQIAPAEGVAMVSGVAYFGFMAGPPTIGFLSNEIGLRWAMFIPAVLAFFLAIGASQALKNFSSK
ncbi:MAG: hypothetical protein RL301_412 [Actinomycetota bacterium]